MAVLSQLILYPIKSCGGIAVDEAVANISGLSAQGVHDREWMLVTEDGQFLTQRELPRMALVVPHIEGNTLTVAAPGMAPLALPIDQHYSGPVKTVRVWDDTVDAADCGDAAAAWFSQAIGTRCRLVRFRPQVVRPTSTKWTGGVPAQTRFADGYPMLLIGAASLTDLNARLVAAGRSTLPMNRFRPNLVVDGIDAYEEDYVEAFQAGDLALRPVKPCARCPIPAIDQATGEPGPDPLDILQSYRAKPQLDGGICFGMNVIVSCGAGAVLRTGQELDVTLAF
ncbi:MOSC domain-containing protein [Massilia horti]|uniref:MOSC domain-containing protein n=1 Tax=Massilia horti TaxID=2562153 RepID=A0A4Y9SYX8_9BURK|nr:MOSC N-terminal beta barrel domain-containing protein [Massilia horti]TFW30767.1 MOSC domain-containing protein [Massilia horti]